MGANMDERRLGGRGGGRGRRKRNEAGAKKRDVQGNACERRRRRSRDGSVGATRLRRRQSALTPFGSGLVRSGFQITGRATSGELIRRSWAIDLELFSQCH